MSTRFWWMVGMAFLLVAIGMLFLEMSPTLFMSIGAVGLGVCFIAQTLEVRETGMTADAVDHYAQTVILSCFVVGFFFHETLWIFATCILVGLVALLVSFGAQIWEKWGESKDLWKRYKKR